MLLVEHHCPSTDRPIAPTSAHRPRVNPTSTTTTHRLEMPRNVRDLTYGTKLAQLLKANSGSWRRCTVFMSVVPTKPSVISYLANPWRGNFSTLAAGNPSPGHSARAFRLDPEQQGWRRRVQGEQTELEILLNPLSPTDPHFLAWVNPVRHHGPGSLTLLLLNLKHRRPLSIPPQITSTQLLLSFVILYIRSASKVRLLPSDPALRHGG